MTAEIKNCLPPDRKPRKPAVVLPKGAIDTHVHVFEPGYALSPDRGYNPPDSTLADLKHLHATLGVDRVVFTQPSVYGTDPSAVPGHDHLVGMPRTGDFNVPWRVFIELFTPGAPVTHITTLAQLQSAWSSGALRQLDSGITFVCAVVSEHAYLAGKPVA